MKSMYTSRQREKGLAMSERAKRALRRTMGGRDPYVAKIPDGDGGTFLSTDKEVVKRESGKMARRWFNSDRNWSRYVIRWRADLEEAGRFLASDADLEWRPAAGNATADRLSKPPPARPSESFALEESKAGTGHDAGSPPPRTVAAGAPAPGSATATADPTAPWTARRARAAGGDRTGPA